MRTALKAHPIVCLSAAQLAGEACARCHRPASAARLVPLRETHILEHLWVRTSLFVCWPECEERP